MLFCQMDDAEPDVEDVVNYPNVRTFFNALEYDDEPQYDLKRVQRGWDLPTPGRSSSSRSSSHDGGSSSGSSCCSSSSSKSSRSSSSDNDRYANFCDV